MSSNCLFPLLQPAYRKNHSTETALLKVNNDLFMNVNKGHVSLLVLLDLSAACDTVDHEILIQRLLTEFGIGGVVVSWFVSYVTGADPGIFYWGRGGGEGGGGPNFCSERTVDFFCGKLLRLHNPYHQSWLHVLTPWPLTVYLSSTRTGYTLETSSSCAWLQKIVQISSTSMSRS